MGALVRGVASCLLLASLVAPARASDEAQRLFDEARAALEAERYAEACPKLERSHALEPQLGTLLHLGHCYEKSGRWEDAWNHFQDALRIAEERRRHGQPDEREAIAQRRAAALEPRISIVTFAIAEPDRAGLSIEHDARSIPRERWTQRFAVPSGSHRLVARAEGSQPWTYDYRVGTPQQVRIDVPPLAAEAPRAATTPVTVAPSPPEPVLAREAAPQVDGGTQTQRIVAYAIGSAAIVAGGFATGFFLAAQHARDEQDPIFEQCQRGGGSCDLERNNQLESDVQSNAERARVALAIGGALLTGAVVLWLTAPDREAETAAVAFGVEPGGASLWVRGPRF